MIQNPTETVQRGTDSLETPFHPEITQGFVFEPIAHWAKESPTKQAISSTAARFTYEELEARTNQIAHALRALGAKHGERVSFIVPRGAEAVLLMVGILKTGACYVPLDPESPRDRIAECLQDATPTLVIYENERLRESIQSGVPHAILDQLFLSADQCSRDALTDTGLQGADLAYIIFTSGTTGRPKGVPITHEALTNFVKGNQVACIQVEPNDRVFQGFSPASDGHHEEVWPCFAAGATLCPATNLEVHSGPLLAAFLNEKKVTIISCAPTLLSLVDVDVPSLRRILFGAEQCPPAMVERWWQPHRTILNTYGPTEATVGATFGVCHPSESINIGKPLPNYYAYVVDENLNEVGVDQEGELALAGVGISPGYFGRDDLSASKFVKNPKGRAEYKNLTLYRTGDLVKKDSEGNLVWLGRVDGQIKIRGHRIELTEIEGVLSNSPAIQSAVVIMRKGTDEDVRLAALLVLREDAPFDVEEMLKQLRNSLPGYMIPQSFEQVDRIPVLPSGKVDRRACGILKGQPIRYEREVLPPSNETEQVLYDIWSEIFPDAEISCIDDFFRDLGGYSLLASKFVSLLRKDHGYTSISVLDLYENPTIRGLSTLLTDSSPKEQHSIPFEPVPSWRYRKAKFVMGFGVFLLGTLSGANWIGPIIAAIYFSDIGFSDAHSLFLGLIVHTITVPTLLLLTIISKWVVGGRFKEGEYPLWSTTFIRWWFVNAMMQNSPIGSLTGTPLAPLYYRLLGAKIGKNVVMESLEMDVPDLIEIGDDCVLENSSWIHCAEVAHGKLCLRKVRMGAGCSLGVRAGLCGGAAMETGASLRDISCVANGVTVPAHEEWIGSPARPAAKPTMPKYDPAKKAPRGKWALYGAAQVPLAFVLIILEFLPFLTAAWALYNATDEENHQYWIHYWKEPLYGVAIVLFACAQILLVKWLVLGKLKPGTYPYPGQLSLRKWFSDKHLEMLSSVVVPVYDSLFARPWCIALGMKCGPRCEIALPRRMPYDLVSMGAESFIASEVSIGRPLRRNGELTLESTVIGTRSFLGNDSVVPQGIDVPDDYLLGVLSLCPDNHEMTNAKGQAWLGSPAFKMPTRQVFSEFDVKQTYRPTKQMYAERLVHEAFRIVLPSILFLIIAAGVVEAFVHFWNTYGLGWAIVLFGPVYFVAQLAAMMMVKISKMLLIGKYKPTTQPLWSRFVWKTETYSAVLHDFAAPLFLSTLQGTPFMGLFMRFVGAKVGHRAFINSTDFTETDLIHIGNDCAINSNAPLQAHLFEDRVIKVGPIWVGDRCSVGHYSVVLCDSTVKSDGQVGHLSLVMKGETIPGHTKWVGSPARAVALDEH